MKLANMKETSVPSASQTATHYHPWLWGLLLLAMTAVAYAPVRSAGFIWDDAAYLTENRLLTAARRLAADLVFPRVPFAIFSPDLYHFLFGAPFGG